VSDGEGSIGGSVRGAGLASAVEEIQDAALKSAALHLSLKGSLREPLIRFFHNTVSIIADEQRGTPDFACSQFAANQSPLAH
jgi:hypothetical protein